MRGRRGVVNEAKRAYFLRSAQPIAHTDERRFFIGSSFKNNTVYRWKQSTLRKFELYPIFFCTIIGYQYRIINGKNGYQQYGQYRTLFWWPVCEKEREWNIFEKLRLKNTRSSPLNSPAGIRARKSLGCIKSEIFWKNNLKKIPTKRS